MSIGDIYTKHHETLNRLGFSILEDERADWFLRQMKARNSGRRFLDIGCRDGTLTKHFLTEFDQVVGVDVDRRALERARLTCPNAAFLEMDLLGDWHELEGKMFDVILCSEVLEHVYFPAEIAKKVRAHLNPGGIFLGSVPNAFFLKHRFRYMFGQRGATPLDDPTHITQFNEPFLRDVLLNIGSKIHLEGYTRLPLNGLAKKWPGVFAFNFLFSVQRD